jgi:hypothetical protein
LSHAVPYSWIQNQSASWINDYETAVSQDQDGDGFMTWEEYWAGTDPTNGASFLKIDSVAYDGTNVIIKWQNAKVGAGVPPLAIQARTNLVSGSWSNVGQKSVVNGVNAWSNSAMQQLYYRLVVTNTP